MVTQGANSRRGIKFVAGNWKMNQGLSETQAFFDQFKMRLGPQPHGEHKSAADFASKSKGDAHLKGDPKSKALEPTKVQACLFPPYLSLQKSVECARSLDLKIEIGSQNAHGEAKGAYTGEVCASMLSEIGVRWALVGHSERRQYFGETSESAGARVRGLLSQGLSVMLCVGETQEQRKASKTKEVIAHQLNHGLIQLNQAMLADQSVYSLGKLVIAYEPVWAIGTGLTATPDEAQQVHQFIREVVGTHAGVTAAQGTQILYGGSVNPSNAHELMSKRDIDGVLVGGASLKADSFFDLLAIASQLAD